MIAYVDVINGPLLKQSNIFVFLNADERTPFQHGCNTERSASASVVENDVSRICVCPDQITTELNRLLGRVVYGTLGFGRLKIDDVSWITAAVVYFKTADKAAAEADMVKQTVTAEKQRELYVAQQEAQIAAETKKVELAERQVAVKERELDATVRKQAEADRYATEQKADAELYTRTKNAEAAKVEAQNKSDADLYSAQKTAEGVSAKAKAEAEATRLKGEADGAAEKAHGEGVAAGIKAQTEAYNGMENAYLLANRYIDVMPEVAEAVAKPLTAVDSIKMYGDGNATKLVRDTTGMVDQVTSGLKDATGIDLTELLSSFHQPFQPREDNE